MDTIKTFRGLALNPLTQREPRNTGKVESYTKSQLSFANFLSI